MFEVGARIRSVNSVSIKLLIWENGSERIIDSG